jgi:hypothetical protein
MSSAHEKVKITAQASAAIEALLDRANTNSLFPSTQPDRLTQVNTANPRLWQKSDT